LLSHFGNERLTMLAQLTLHALGVCEKRLERKLALELVTLDKSRYPPDLRHDLPRNDKEVKQ